MSVNVPNVDLLKTYCLSGTLNFTRYFFHKRFNRKFVVGDHHVAISSLLDDVLAGRVKKAIINISPRYGKTELAVKAFIAEGLAINPKSKFIHLSYSDDLARDNSMGVQEIMNVPMYQQLFDAEPISHGTKKWYTKEGGGLYAVSSSGQVTGFGAGLVDHEADTTEEDLDEFSACIGADESFGGAIIIDDPIKPDDAMSSTIRDKVNSKFDTTIRNRVNSRKTPIIIIMQRLHENDLCGYLIGKEPGQWTVLSLPCIYDNDEGEETALWPFKHTLEELKAERNNNPFVFETQYMQNPKPLQGLMYATAFRTYGSIPYSSKMVRKAYIDTADTGKDFLCAICYVETETANYITDVLYTQQAMEITEPKTAELLSRQQTKEVAVEANNGGRGFSRNVEKECRLMNNNLTTFTTFHQSENKEIRIFTHSAAVHNITYFPFGWDKLWPQFYRDVTNYMKVGKNDHDDAVDALTGTYERRDTGGVQDLGGYF